MNILAWIVLGLVAGLIAKFLMPGSDPGGLIVTILIGIAGALLGGWLGDVLLGGAGETAFTWTGLLTAIIGALILLFVYRMFAGRSTTGRGTTRRP